MRFGGQTSADLRRFGLVLMALLTVMGISSPGLAQTPTDYTTYYRYDAMRRVTMKIGPDPDGTGVRRRAATSYHYNADGLVDEITAGTVGSPTDTVLVPKHTTTYRYDAVGNKIWEKTPGALTQFSYDADDRLVCTALRMNPSLHDSLDDQDDVCLQSGDKAHPGLYGADRITRTVYDAAGQVTEVRRGVDTSLEQIWSKTTYTDNGKVKTVADAVKLATGTQAQGFGNKTTYTYDGFDRLIETAFPSRLLNVNASNTGDVETYDYDKNGNLTELTKRGGELTFAYEYDALNRLKLKRYPGDATRNVYTEYDLLGRVLAARFGSPSGEGVVSTYDKAGRRVTETTNGIVVRSRYDKAGNRDRVTWSDDFYVAYDYDNAGLLKTISEPPGKGLVGDKLAGFTYDDLGRRDRKVAGSIPGVVPVEVASAYNPAGQLESLRQGGFANGQAIWQDFLYNPANQIIELVQHNPSVVWDGHPDGTTDKLYNGLNQDYAIALDTNCKTAQAGYDCRGNLLTDGTRDFTYDAENRLTGVSGASGLTIAYDPLGRILTTTATQTGTKTRFVYDGDRLVGEYAINDLIAPVRRYAHGVGTDEPLVWYEGSGWTDRRWLHADRQGSILGYSYASGNLITYAYGPYGEVETWEGSRFRYTGQIALQEAQLFHYKARAYDPTIGRFLQTDPSGYDDGLNWYAYVGNDPLNKTDPTGLYESNAWLRAFVPGQVAWDNAITAAEGGHWGQAAVQTGVMVAESALFVATLGQSMAASRATQAVSNVAIAGASQADFAVTKAGTAIPKSQSVMEAGFEKAGMKAKDLAGKGRQYELPSGNRVRTMEPQPNGAGRRASFENSRGQPVSPDGKPVQPPRGTQDTQKYVRDRTHVDQH